MLWGTCGAVDTRESEQGAGTPGKSKQRSALIRSLHAPIQSEGREAPLSGGLAGEGCAARAQLQRPEEGLFLHMCRCEHPVTKSMKKRGEMTKTGGPRKAPEASYENEST